MIHKAIIERKSKAFNESVMLKLRNYFNFNWKKVNLISDL